jgi:hypothetical protein
MKCAGVTAVGPALHNDDLHNSITVKLRRTAYIWEQWQILLASVHGFMLRFKLVGNVIIGD